MHDYWAWNQELYNGDIINRSTLDEAFSSGGDYSFGWFLSGNSMSHTGSTVGFRTAVRRFPDKKLTVVVFMNSEGSASAACDAISRLY